MLSPKACSRGRKLKKVISDGPSDFRSKSAECYAKPSMLAEL